MYQQLKKYIIILCACTVLFFGCTGDSVQKVFYEMQQLAFAAGKINEQINIQPNLATSADSAQFRDAHIAIIDYYIANRDNSLDSTIQHNMGRLALASQLTLARYYSFHRNADSVLMAYRRIGADIPAGRDDIAGAALGIALTYRSLRQFDSTIAIYDRVLRDYYPPLDYYDRPNNDILAIPVDKLKIVGSLDDESLRGKFIEDALSYYNRLKTDFPDNPYVIKTASVHASRVYAISERWDEAVAELSALTDSTGQMQVESMVLIGNIYNGPMKDLDGAIDIYNKILAREPDSSIIGQTLLRLGIAYCAQDDYEAGRKQFVKIKNKFHRKTNLLAQTQLYYAQTFREQGRWERTLSELQWLMEAYPYTEEAYRAVRLIPEHFSKEGDSRLAEIWFDRAIDFYKRAAQNKQGQIAGVAANSYLADTYRRVDRWDDALETLEKIYTQAPRSKLAAKALYNAAGIAFQELNDTTRAQGYLDKLNSSFGTTDSTLIHEDTENN
ncbi:MAG: tetratricopeptide repeat protein [candidate division Zixibacteria bacterium]|nr:tetratricopeptide repeat protein [candidate division Zixibacteria bacterium]